MNKQNHLYLVGERTALRRMIEETPAEDVIDRGALVARLEEVEEELAAATIDEREPVRVSLTFSGEPVEGSRSIDAQFGGKAVSLFTEAVALTAASFSTGEQLQPGGPIPGARDRRLRIIGAAVGSFGFELELPPPETPLPAGVPDPEAEALAATLTTLSRALAGDEEGLSESLSTIDLRATRKLGEFVTLSLNRRALFSVRFEGRRLVVPDHAATSRAAAALRPDDVKQQTVTFRATLTGLRPSKPDFECTREGGGEVLLGSIDRRADIPRIQALLGQSAPFRFRETRVRAAQARYVLLGVAEPGEDEPGT